MKNIIFTILFTAPFFSFLLGSEIEPSKVKVVAEIKKCMAQGCNRTTRNALYLCPCGILSCARLHFLETHNGKNFDECNEGWISNQGLWLYTNTKKKPLK